MATGGARAPSDADLNEWYGRVFSESKWIEFLMLLDVSASSQLYNRSDTVRRLLDSADFGVKDFCCIKIVKAASSKREWELVETTIAKAEAFSAQDECRKIAIRRLLDQSPTDSEWDYIKKYLVAKTETGIKDSCYFEAMKKAAENRRPELILELMDIVDSSDNIEECFQTALTSAKSAEDSKKFVAQLLDKVKYQESNIVLRCYTRAIKFAFTLDSGMRNAKSDRKSKSENHWSWILQLSCCAIKHRDLPAAKGYDLLKFFLKEAIRKLSWSEVCQTLEIIFHYNIEHHELPFTIKNGWLKIVLNGAIRNSNWSVICQILEIIFRFVERQKLPVATKKDWLNFILTEAIRHSNWSVVCQILSILGTTDNFDPLQKVQTLNENKNISELLEKLKTIDKIEWAISVTLIHYFAQEKQNIALTDEIVLILTEEVLHLDRSLDRVVKERMGPFNIIKILDKSRHINDFLRRVSSCTKSRGDLKNHLLLQYLRPESEPICSVDIVPRPCDHSRLSSGFAVVGIQSFNRHQEKCTSTTCHCGSKDRCIPKLIESAASKYDWQDVLEIVRHNNSYAKIATDAYLKMFNKNNQNDVKEYLEMIKLSVVHIESENDWEYIIKILRLIDTPTSKCQGFVTAVNAAFQHRKSELALKLVDAAQVENIEVCPIFKDQLRIERYSASNSTELKQLINKLTNRICPRWNYQRLGSADIESEGFQASSMCICHPTRNSLCDQLWPALPVVKNPKDRNWKLVLLLLTEVTDADDRDQKCLQLLPKAIEKNKARIACDILKLVSKELTRKRDHFCSKISNIIGKGETVALLIGLIRLASTKKVIKHCHFRAFIGALRTRNFSMILYIVRSKFRPDFTHPDILHFLANEALLGDFELIKLIFGELKRCAQENYGIDIQFSRECHDMIAAVLFKSMSEGHVALASAILDYADTHYRTKDSEQPFELETTLLIAAAHCGHHELAEQILAKHASVDEKDSQGRTALSWASIWGHIKTVKTLIDNGARIMHKDNDDATCIQLASLHHQSDVLKLLLHHDERTQEDSDRKYKQMSLRLHKSLCDAGFTEQRAKVLQQMADCLQQLARDLTKEDWHLTGSYSDGVGNSLVQVNGRTASDSDIDWTVIIRPSIKDWDEEEEDEEEEDKEEEDEEEDRARNLKKLTFHLMGHCKCDDTPEELERSIVRDGHAETKRPAGSQPASASSSCGLRPAQDICHAYACCSGYGQDRVRVLLPNARDEPVHLVTATGLTSSNEMRLSFSFREKEIMRRLTTVQGQLFVLIKFIFKRLLPKTWKTTGLKTYHARSVLFFMLERKLKRPQDWEPENLVSLLREALLSVITNREQLPDEAFMKHFFMPDSYLHYKNAGITGGAFDATNQAVLQRLWDVFNDPGVLETELSKLLKPLESTKFYFHPFTLLPLTVPPEEFEGLDIFARIYSLVFFCIRELHSDEWEKEEVLRLVETLPDSCKSAKLCIKVMCFLKSDDIDEALTLLCAEQNHQVLTSLNPEEVAKMKEIKQDWLWRFCFVDYGQPEMEFLPALSRLQIRTKRPIKGAAYLHINFRCLWASFKAELLNANMSAESSATCHLTLANGDD